jgi:signal transduction histidine kinase
LQPAAINLVQQHDEAASVEEFMSVAAHDLRNPIAVVRASAQMAQRQMARGDRDAANGRLQAIVEQTDRLTEMLETFLDAARIASGKLPLRRERVDLRDALEDAIGRARMLVGDQADRTVETEIPDDCVGSWDRPRTVRALRSLLTNALQYGDPSRPVRAVAHRVGDRVSLSVSGGGAGPTSDEIGHLFERFYRGPSAAETGQAGSGLGLYTARGIARGHGGDVRRTDGDTFEIELPLAAN